MPFTAPSVANKGNRFRIGPRTDILVAAQELVVFNILQGTLMLIPTLGLQPVSPCPDSSQDLALSPGGRLIALQLVSFQPEDSGSVHVLPPGRVQISLPPRQPCSDPQAGLSYQPASFSSNDRHFPGGILAVDNCYPPAALPDSGRQIEAPPGPPAVDNCCPPLTLPDPTQQFQHQTGSLAGDNCCHPPALPGPDRQSTREGESPCYVELIVVNRVLDSTCRADEALLVWPFIPPGPTPGVPVKVLACRIKNLVSWSRLLPLSSRGQALALAYYTYEVEIVYTDSAGRTATLTLESGPRHQQAVVCCFGSGYLEVDVRVSCLGSSIASPVIPSPGPQPPPAYKPVRVWLQARPARKK